MFWGLIIEPNKRYTQTVEKSFHVSMASLDLTTADDNLVQVMLCYDNRNYLLCSLRKSTTWQVPLDLNFQEGTKIAFTCNGHGHVHLTGYLIPDEDLDLDEEEDDEEAPQLIDKLSKRKAMDSLKNEKNAKRRKQELEAESSDDQDIELDDLNEESDTDDSEEEGDESILNHVEMEDNEEDDDSDEEDEEEGEEEKVVKPQKKDKKNKQQQQQNQQKKKLLNGKEAKHEQQNKQQKKNKGEQQQINDQNIHSDQKKRLIEGGVQIEELKVGNGTPAKAGKFVSVYYVGRLKNGKKFDATTQGEGFKFRLGKGEVIKGWDVGIVGMKVGGKRRVTIPPAMAYGAKGSPPIIPGNSTLVFEVELRNVH
ncbi:46 kDa FK506-binding nuclear protein [Hylaeus volcanicus]|uniref:46 kDa FK506-binding nuclear protein n=1 Tax=Hylaeus volcanicus TaxID=313075 RepID=UPI0023B81015|nr:46 kDa FK506-binding nuclear protein [Hylaeus volcanicus]XP_053989351.1 46 kDa FK506-binding nuclear protein [Hylaeus volcanicus]